MPPTKHKDKDKNKGETKMGWTTCFTATEWKYQGGKRMVDRRKECDKMLTWVSKDKDDKVIATFSVLKSAMVGSTYYAAVEKKKTDGTREVFAAIFLTCGKGSDGTIWGYKDMDETMGPCQYDCPASILALLTPTEYEHANEWRRLCRENMIKKAEERKNPPKLYAPNGVDIRVKDRSWVITSQHYRDTHTYTGVRFAKARFHTSDRAMVCFLHNYGTAEQKKEFAMSGRECPAEWKGVAA